jgi:glycosyltransferase involved in cell wall biosynthesis
MARTDVCVVVPLYNEATVVRAVIEQARQTFPRIVCVDDGSSEDSVREATLGGAVVVQHQTNLGQGAAIRTGLDYALQDELGKVYAGPMATGENLFSMQDARNLIRYGGMRPDRDWLQFDCALSYGLVEYLRTLDMLREHGWSPSRCIPHGGHQMSLAIAAGLGLGGNESYPDLFQPYGGFPDGVRVVDGYVNLPPLLGIGFEGKSDLIAQMREVAE